MGPPWAREQGGKRLLVRVAPEQVGMFRFLLEAYENVAYFTVLNRHDALLKVVFSPHREKATRTALSEIASSIEIEIREWPFSAVERP